jgi:hypothetical protein
MSYKVTWLHRGRKNFDFTGENGGKHETEASKFANYVESCAIVLAVAIVLAGCAGPEGGGSRVEEHWSSTELEAFPEKFFVATNGNDAWSGRANTPNRSKTDGPVATPGAALRAVRNFREQNANEAAKRVVIVIRDGLFLLPEPLTFKPEDSDVLLTTYPGEKPVLSGGRRITAWKEVEVAGRKLWAATVPEARDNRWVFRELWVNGKRAVRARYPNKGYLSIADLPDKVADWTQGHTRFRFREGDLKAWSTNAEVVAMTRWVESRLPVTGVDEKERIISFGKRSVFELAAGDLYYVEGALEALDEPGEWYLDSLEGQVYYWPRTGEKIDNVEVIAPVLTQVLRIEGGAKPVERVRISGLTFAHTEWYFPGGFDQAKDKPKVSPPPKAEVGGFAQAAIGVPGAVWAQGARECAFESCKFTHLGSYGLELGRGCQQNRIVGSEFFDLGAGGLKIGETRIAELAAELCRSNEVRNCHIHDGGLMFHSGEGIWVGQSPDNRIEHNHIHDFYYTGISLGWTWGYKASLATNNLIAFNHVHHIGVKSDGDGPILSDMGGIYTLGNESGTIIRNNLWHDIAGLRYGGWGIYFDEGSSGILAENNVVYRTTHGGFHQHYGETNVVRNNIFAFGRDAQIQRTRAEPHISFSFQTNIVYFDSGTLLTGDWSNENYVMDWNIYFDARTNAQPEALRLGPTDLAKWRARSHDRNSLVADPRFVAPEHGDFRLRHDSPARKIGFREIDLKTHF